MITLETLIANASRLGKESQHVALACALLPGLGHVRSLCVWCAEGAGLAYRLPRGGECSACSYAGYDCLVVAPEATGTAEDVAVIVAARGLG